MATDFFERQTVARRNTKWLVAMFVLAVVGIVGTTMVVTAIGLGAAAGEVPLALPLMAGAGALVLIVGGSLFKIAQLAGGGSVVAERLGGRRVFPNTTDQVERRLLNVVEEMALASGVPVPAVFLLSQEEGLNAFAAGFSPGDAVVGVTRGTAEQLSREQLQGVVAHEFSHILNGDMRLNLRLMGILHGILLMGLVGRELLRIGAWGGGRSRSKKDNGMAYMLFIGLAFMAVGFLGLLFGNLIKAAVSRQREYLADASAVQFTRNPEGIAGALKRIGAAVFGSKIVSPCAGEASHMYFATGVASLFATHPALDDRIRRLEPRWDGEYPPALPAGAVVGLDTESAAASADPTLAAMASAFSNSVPPQVVCHAADQTANPTLTHREYVRRLIAEMPPAIVDAAHEPYGARAVIFATLLDRDAEIRATQLRALERSVDKNVFELTLKLVPAVNQLDMRARLPLVDMTLPALRSLSFPQFQEFAKCFADLVQADKRLGLFEWTLHEILMRHLRPQFEPVRSRPIRYHALQQLSEPTSILLSALSNASQRDTRLAFDAGASQLSNVSVHLLPPDAYSLESLRGALEELSHTDPKLRQQLVDACAACICADAAVNIAEAELLRAVCDMLDCPMPPLLPGQAVKPIERAPREPSRV